MINKKEINNTNGFKPIKENYYYDTELLNDTIQCLNISETSKREIKYTMLQFLKCNNITLEHLIDNIKDIQHDRIEKNIIIRYNPNDKSTLIYQYFNNYINYLQYECNNKASSINTKLYNVKSVLKYHNIKLPKIKLDITNQYEKKIILTNKDIQYMLNHCNIHQKALYTFMASTGIRRGDILNFTIYDFLKATYKYHNTLNINEFFNKIESNYIVGYWEFKPQKTRKKGIICKTCNSSESSYYIIESLKERMNYLNKKGLDLTENMYLFSNKFSHYTGRISDEGLTTITSRKNNDYFKPYKLKDLEMKLKNNIISINEYEKYKNNLPIFHLHGLRSFFSSTLSQYIANNNIRVLMEGHTSNIETDKHYIGENEELYNEKIIIETYKTVEPYLTFNNTEVLSSNSKNENKELLNKINELENKYNETKELLNYLNRFVDVYELKEGVTDFNKMKKIRL